VLSKRSLKQLTTADLTQAATQRSLLFNPGEHVGYKSSVYADSYAPAQFFCINPLPSVLSARTSANLMARRNLLIEFDKPSWTLTKQETFYEQKLQLPFATKTYSGGRSLHYIVALTESISDEDYYLLFQLLQRACGSNSDKQVSNPNRLSRTAGVLRDGVNRQELLATGQRVTLADLTLRLANIMPIEYNRYLNDYNAKKATREVAKDVPEVENYRLPYVFQRIIDTCEWPKDRYESRHDLLVKAGCSLNYDQLPLDYIEGVLYKLSGAIGMERDDVPNIMKYLEKRG